MTPITTGFVAMAALLFLLALGVPIGFAMILVGAVGLIYVLPVEGVIHILGHVPYSIASSWDFGVLPLFLFMAAICLATGLGEALYRFAHILLGRLRGGLSIATIGACALFSAASASSIATAVTIGLVALPEMKKYKYDNALSAGCVAAGGTLGILIPPSGVLIVYGIITEQPIGDLFVAGLIPGIILALAFMVMVYFRARLNPALAPPGPATTLKEKIRAIGESAEMLVLIMFIVGGLIIGWFTPTEAGGIGAFGAIVFSLIRGRLKVKALKDATLDTLKNTGMIFAILIGAFVFNPFLAVTTIPMELAEIIGNFALPPSVVMGFIICTYFILGCFIDAMAMVILTIPIYFPLATSLGFDPIWFGILIVLVAEIAMITPPVGMNVYIVSGIARDVPMVTIFRGVAPFVAVEIAFVVLLTVFPQIALFLPGLMK